MNPQSDEILEGLRPRMRQARLAHVRRMMAGVAMVPLIAFGAIAMTVDNGDAPELDTAGPGIDDSGAPDVELPNIGDGDSSENESPENHETESTETEAEQTPESIVPVEQTKVLSLGPLGEAEVARDEDGFELLHADLVEGWNVESVDITDEGITIVIAKGGEIKVIAITEGLRDEVDVRVTDLVIPTTTTAPPPTTTTEKVHEPDPAPIVDRFTVVVDGKGSFVVEREGDTLWAGNVTANEGYDYEVVQGEGWKVYVKFTNGEWNWFGKALINDHGEVEQHFWDEAPPFEPVYQWVEVPEVGAVKFKLWSDGLVYVKDHELAAGFGFWDYNEGQPAEVAKIDFEGDGVLWIVEAWGNEDGGLSWSTTDQSPTQ